MEDLFKLSASNEHGNQEIHADKTFHKRGEIVDWIKGAIEKIKQAALAVWEGIKKAANAILDAAMKVINEIVNFIKKFIFSIDLIEFDTTIKSNKKVVSFVSTF